MAEYIESILETVGRTPIVRLSRYGRAASCAGQIFAKVESFNPGGSVKDRVALNMIETAEKEGLLTPGGTIIEPTSGNTGVGLALVGATRGYKVILTMPETMSVERRKLLAALGAEIVLTPGQQGMKGAIAEAERLRDTIDGSVILGQFVNPANPAVHYNVTAPEVFDAMDGRIDFFVAGVGTGGTISGIGRYLRERIPGVGIVAVEPADSPVISGGTPGPHAIQGIGAGFIPATFDSSVVTEVVRVTTDEAFGAARLLARTEGILAGISSGAALHAATAIASRPENAGKNIVVLLPDTGERYLSTALFQ
ncbi:MAG: cysteine synthase A [Duncaniella sp.]|nr:cysteine synthase A [Duncaniella sp.]MDE6766273.1 cysteine synthase A [Duncaniella sp.]